MSKAFRYIEISDTHRISVVKSDTDDFVEIIYNNVVMCVFPDGDIQIDKGDGIYR